MEKQTEEIEELDELKDTYSIEDKLFNMTASQMSESSKSSVRDF